jgi:hypothetical protein
MKIPCEQGTLSADTHSAAPLLATNEVSFYEYCDHVGEQRGVRSCPSFDFEQVPPLSKTREFETED